MNMVWTVAHNDIRRFLRDKSGYVWLFLVPFLFTYFFGSAFKGDTRAPTNPKPQALIDNRDAGFMGALTVRELDAQGLRAVSPDSEDAGKVSRGVRIPVDFTERILARQPVDIELFTVQGGDLEASQMLEVRLLRAIIATLSNLIELDGAGLPVARDTLEALMDREDPVQLRASFAGRRAAPSGFDQSVPGIMVMFLIINLIAFGGASVADERNTGTLRRLAGLPITREQLILGKILGRFLLGLVQILFFGVIGAFLFGMRYDGPLAPLLATLAVYAWGCAALGALIGALIANPDKVVGLGVLAGNVMAALGGCWWPIEVAPDFMKTLAKAFPTGWAMSALHQLMSFGGSWPHIVGPLLALTAFALAATALAAKLLRC